MGNLKKITDERYISRFFRNMARKREIEVSILHMGKQYDGTMFFSGRRGIEPGIRTNNESTDFKVGEMLDITFHNSEVLFFFQSEITSIFKNTCTLNIPSILFSSFRRLMSRYRVGNGEEPYIEFSGEKKFKVFDISSIGLSFLSEKESYYYGQEIKDISVIFPNGSRINMGGVIKHARSSENGNFIYGMSFSNIDLEAYELIFMNTFYKIYPRLKILEEADYNDVIKIYEKSKFLSTAYKIKNMALCLTRENFKNFIRISNNKMITSGLIYYKGDKALSLGTVFRMFRRSFIGHQIISLPDAKLSTKPIKVVQSGICDFLITHPYFDYFISYIYLDLARNLDYFRSIEGIINDRDRFFVDSMQCIECNCSDYDISQRVEGYDCIEMKDTSDFIAFCSESLTPIEVNAYSFNEEEINSSEIKQVLKLEGVQVDRGIWRIDKDGMTVAYAVAESFSGDISLLNPVDVCRFYFTTQSSSPLSVIKSLMPKAILFYTKNNKETFRIFVKAWDKVVRDIKMPGMEYCCPVGRVISNKEGMVEYKKYLNGDIVSTPRFYKLTHPQLAIWYTEMVYPGTNFANISGIVRIKENVNFKILERAINIVIQYNDGLRIRLTDVDDDPKQYVSSYRYRSFNIYDFASLGGEEALYSWDEYKNGSAFKLADSNLFQFVLFSLSENEGGFYIKTHHLISDAWTSSNLIISKIMEHYESMKSSKLHGRKMPSYVDYVFSEEGYINSELYNEHRKFWKSKFDTVPELMSLKPVTSSLRNTKADRRIFTLPAELSVKVHEFCAKTKSSPFSVFMSILSVYMNRITSKNDMVIATPILNRSNVREKGTVGMFVSVVPVRLVINKEMTFKQYITYINNEWKLILKNQRFPYDMILNDFRETHKISENLFDTVISYQNSSHKKTDVEYDVEWVFNGHQADTLAIHISDRDNEGVFTMEFDYLLCAYSDEEIDQMYEYITNLLDDAIGNPSKKLTQLEILSENARNKLLYEFNDTKRDYPNDKTIPMMFEEQAEKTPDAIAVVFGDNTLTYRELNSKSNQLARILREKGVTPNSITGIMIERSFEMIIGIMAILKAGGAYLPIDPDYPCDRIEYMLSDSQVKLLLTNSSNKNMMDFDREVLFLDELCLDNEIENLSQKSSQNNIAYEIYTSGSTGKPKGVLIGMKSLVNLCYWYKGEYSISENSRVLLIISFGFDASVKNILTPLISGGQMVLAPSGYYDAENVLKIINCCKVTHINCVPSAIYPIIELAEKNGYEELSSIEFLLLGGESMILQKLKKWLCKPECGCILGNVYGPTECTDISTSFMVGKGEIESLKTVPIGKPINNSFVYIMNEKYDLQPIGVVGELYISGEGIAIGYMNRPDLTAEKFLSNPFFKEEIMYKTGDLARWLPDGNIEYMGRADYQVKIRGFRIELGEIENCLISLDDVKEAAIKVIDRANGDKSICAYYVSDKTISISEIRNDLYKEIPEYMIPTYFVQLEKMPLTPNGKIDRKLLPEPSGKVSDSEIIPPTNKTEEKMVEIWKGLLGIDSLSINDNFFETGGDSLKAISLVAKIHKEFKVDIPVGKIFADPTVEKLSKIISKSANKLFSSIEPILEQKEFYHASAAQKRMYMINQIDSGSLNYNMPGAITIDGKLDIIKLESAINRIIERHESLRTSFDFINGEIVQKVHKNKSIKLLVFESGEDISPKTKEFIRPFDMKNAPLLRAEVLKISEEKHVLLLDMHHIISDGVSMSIILKELTGIFKGEELPKLRIQYKEFAIWQNGIFNSKQIDKQKEFWINTLSGEIPILNLPTDFKRPPVQSFEGEYEFFSIDRDLSKELNELAGKTGTTLYMVLLAAYNILLSKYSSQEDIIVGSPITGRSHADLENIVGMFVNTLVMRNYPDSKITFLDFLEGVRQNALSAYENQDYQFDELLENLQIQRELSRNPLFDTMFVLQNIDMPEITTEKLKFSVCALDVKVSKFDILLQATEKKGVIDFELMYCTKLFKSETIKRLANHFVNILRFITENPNCKLHEIDILSSEERKQILYDFNNTKADYPKDKTIIDLFEEQVAKTPDNIAVVFGDNQLTYRELNEKANQLAGILLQNSIGPGSIVGLITDRSLEMVVGILSIMKAGGAYLPIDPQYSEERINYIIEDSNTKIALVAKSIEKNIHIKAITIDIEKIDGINNIDNKGISISPENGAYMIYTSGSTGKPKGVLISIKSLVNLCFWYKDEYSIMENSRVLVMIPFTFDASVKNIITPIIVGGQAVLVPSGHFDAFGILDLIESKKVTLINCVPSAIYSIIDIAEKCGGYTKLSSIEYLLLGGESMNLSRMTKWIGSSKFSCTIGNIYGPTECTDISTCYKLRDGDYSETRVIPIGKPIKNTKLLIVGRNKELQPIGVIGELCISGDGLSKGYINRLELTSEKFLTNPFNSGELMYRTGDLARWLPDGNIEYLGRIDNQVKIRGNRIELGEIENQIGEYNQIKEAAVIDHTIKGSKYLCAYFLSENDLNVSELRRYLLERLPDYMVPSYFIRLEKIPLSHNGKVDRKALPEPDVDKSTDDTILPENEIETKLISICKEVLGIKNIGTNNNFFELGGDSLSIIKVLSAVYSFNWNITMQDFYKYKTLKEICDKIGGNTEQKTEKMSNIDEVYQEKRIFRTKINIERRKKRGFYGILLTGSTGFLGIHILEELVEKQKNNIYCLIRGNSQSNAEKKLRNLIDFYFNGKYNELINKRIFVVNGDIISERFGLAKKAYSDLGGKIGLVIHSAANVKHYGDYSDFEKVNVGGTREVIHFCENFNTKLNHISTISVSGNEIVEGNEEAIFSENDLYIGQNYMDNVYVRSKFVAEELVHESIENGLEAIIFRVGNLTGRYRDGQFQINIKDNSFYNILKSIMDLGVISNEIAEKQIEFTPIDLCSEAIIKASMIDELYGKVFHLFNHNLITIHQLLEKLSLKGIDIQIMDGMEFNEHIRRISREKNERNLLNGLINEFISSKNEHRKPTIKVDSSFSKDLLKGLGFNWPKVSNGYIDSLYNHMKQTGFLNKK